MNRHQQSGVILIEALIGVVIFAIGVLAMIALQARAIAVQSDAQYRIEAAKLVDQLVGQIALNVDRTNTTTIQTSLAPYQHQPTITAVCNYTGGASASATVTNWVNQVMTDSRTRIVGTTASMIQVLVDTVNFNTVTVTICWQTPNNPTPNRHSVVAYIN